MLGTEHLFAADVVVFPRTTPSNTQTPTIAVAERAADNIGGHERPPQRRRACIRVGGLNHSAALRAEARPVLDQLNGRSAQRRARRANSGLAPIASMTLMSLRTSRSFQ